MRVRCIGPAVLPCMPLRVVDRPSRTGAGCNLDLAVRDDEGEVDLWSLVRGLGRPCGSAPCSRGPPVVVCGW